MKMSIEFETYDT